MIRTAMALLLAASVCLMGMSAPAEGAADRVAAMALDREDDGEMRLTIGETPVAVRWEDNDAVDALRELARDGLTIQMSMYGGFEQVGDIGRRLPTDDAQTTTGPGDIVLYAGDSLVVFYGSNTWAYTRLGQITDRTAETLRSLLGSGDVTIRLTLDRNEGEEP